MTDDLELVTTEAPDQDALATALTTAWFTAGLDEPSITGRLDVEPLVEVITGGALVLQVHRPFTRTTEAGPRWVTAMTTSTEADPPLLDAVLALAAALAAPRAGHLTVNGELVDLDGVATPDPRALVRAAGEEGPTPEHMPTFASVFLGVATPDADGWRTMLGALAAWVGEHDTWLPGWILPNEEWEPFSPDDPTPVWWPDTIRLTSGGDVAHWRVVDAGFPDSRLAQLDVELRVPLDDAADLLAGMRQLTMWQPAFGMVQAWHPDEPFLVEGMRQEGDEPPYLMLTDRGLAEGLPNLYWGTLLGPPWAEEIGAERLASTPAHRVEEVAPGRWLLQLTPRASDVVDDRAAFTEVRERCKDHLGRDLFRADDGFECLAPRPLPIPTLAEREGGA